MKAKRITLLVSIISVILVFVVLSSTVFSLNRVEFCYLQNPIYYKSNNISKEVIKSGDFDFGQSIFLIDKDKHIEKIENDFPYLKVVGIETVFPNRLVIQTIERTPFFAVPNQSNDHYAICDGDLKILRVIGDFTTNQYPIIDNSILSFANAKAGQFLKIEEQYAFIKELSSIYKQIGYNETQVASLVRHINIADGALRINSYNNYRIEIQEPDKFLTQKIALAYDAIFGESGVSEDFSGLIYVFHKGS